MPLASLTVASVNLDANNPSTICPPPPWTVAGNVDPNGNNLTTMAYQIDDGPVNSFPLPANLGAATPYSFTIDDSDIPAPGLYLLTVYAWDDSPTSLTTTWQIVLTSNNNGLALSSTVQGCSL